jgi:hypothetical protein
MNYKTNIKGSITFHGLILDKPFNKFNIHFNYLIKWLKFTATVVFPHLIDEQGL